MGFCANCGSALSGQTNFCTGCGAAAAKKVQPPEIRTRARTESFVASIAPEDENSKIQQMELFGWSLQGRQEIIGPLQRAAIPDSLLSAVGRGAWEGATGRTTVSRDHYVKLHFVRDPQMEGIERLRALENEYFSLQFPAAKGIVWPVLFTLMPIPGGFAMIAGATTGQGSGPGLQGLIVVAGWMALGVVWIRNRIRSRHQARATTEASIRRAYEIEQQLIQMAA
jgi:hypothetical protein